ncbi:flagellar hook assembly protein FlgD [Chelatococcus sambhunathii]|uniref:Basal-body rod modification protein FlgD n=1 Tax=Chelatococcus sambhunathii TaxID=363953 RepID=A0ABU1DCC7_9HYPH|nr:flagellar hook assembly protein FlgD [Chelatococcus sambhunathii]MDR4305768.1 flagellar hook assembly protein FlgD [Chelatococcus sambhunathii]
MAVNSVTGPGSNAAQVSNTSGATLASNFETFLSLLTTQLRNQSPLDPLDTNQFTQQLVQFAGVEQQLKTNDTLSALLLSSQTAQAGAALNLVGREVTAFGQTSQLSDGKATWNLDSPKAGVTATITIRDSTGALVYTGKKDLKSGDQDFVWDGKRTDGTKAPEGLYTISVDAKDAAGNAVEVTSEVAGVVEGVDLSTGEAILLIGDIRVPLGQLKSVKALKA